MSVNTAAPAARLKRFRASGMIAGRFVAQRTWRSAALWALVFGVYVVSKAVGYATAYPTPQAREQLGATLGGNVGLVVLLGTAHHMETVAGSVAWNTLGVMAIVGSIWGLLVATKVFRGEEEAGRWELFLAGPTTARRATASALLGLSSSVLLLFVATAALFVGVGHLHNVGFAPGTAVFFALAAVMGAGLFAAIGTLASQLMPTRSRAAMLTVGVFGLFFVLRAAGDVLPHAHWLLNVTPLGWIENLRPLYGSQPLWLVPIGALMLLAGALAVYIAGWRDLGASLIADRDTAKPRTALLRTPLLAALRLTRARTVAWLAVLAFMGGVFGLMTQSATQAFASSPAAEQVASRLAGGARHAAATAFLGIIFLMVMTTLMAYAASAVNAMRDDEARGYLDNLLVQPVSRLRWLWGRLLLAAIGIELGGLVAGLSAWAGAASQHVNMSMTQLLLAGVNAATPALLVLGMAVLSFGFVPRLTGFIGYGIIAWSFLVQMISSGVNLSHWLLDTSLLHHVALAPASPPKWGVAALFALIGAAACLAGSWRFHRRDLQAE